MGSIRSLKYTRYMTGQLVVSSLFVSTGLIGMVWLSQSLRSLDLVINQGITMGEFLTLVVLLLPSIVMINLPIGILIAVIHVYSKLSADRELLVLRAAGVGQWGLVKPAMIVGVLSLVLGFAMTLYLSPASYREFKETQTTLRAGVNHLLFKEGEFRKVADGVTVHVRKRENDGRLIGFLAQDNRDLVWNATISAEYGRIVLDNERPVLALTNGNRTEVNKTDQSLRIIQFDSYVLELLQLVATPTDRDRRPREYFLHELYEQADTASDSQRRKQMQAEIHLRILTPFHAITLALIGVAAIVSGSFNRRHRWPRIAVGMGTGLTYVILMVFLDNVLETNPAIVVPYYLLPVLAALTAIWFIARPQHAFRIPLRRAERTGWEQK